eukprot:531951-Pyramimonas_sp.AAC.1
MGFFGKPPRSDGPQKNPQGPRGALAHLEEPRSFPSSVETQRVARILLKSAWARWGLIGHPWGSFGTWFGRS